MSMNLIITTNVPDMYFNQNEFNDNLVVLDLFNAS